MRSAAIFAAGGASAMRAVRHVPCAAVPSSALLPSPSRSPYPSSLLARSLLSTASTSTSTSAPAPAPAPAPVRVSLVVERGAVVVPAPTALEAAYARYRDRVADERAKPYVDEFFTKKTDSKAAAAQAAADADAAGGGEDSTEDKVTYAPATTAADAARDTSSMDRQLDRTLYFVVRGHTGGWQFPETQPDRSKPLLTEAGAAHVTSSYGGKVPPKLFFAGHAPAAVFKPTEASAVPIFFFRSQLLSGELAASDGHAWLTRDELKSAFTADYFKAVEPVLSQ